MSSNWLADDAYKSFKSEFPLLIRSCDKNEATTRLRVIDTLLRNVLGWDPLHIEAEKYARTVGFADYLFGKNEQWDLVLEAKKEEIEFVLPSKDYPAEPVPFALIAKECPAAADALRQAQGYASQLGARYAAISNGAQWLFALTFVEHHTATDRLVFVYESLEAIDRKFRQFFETFSPAAITTNLPTLHLLNERKAPAPPKLSTRITGYPLPADRNLIANTLSGVLQLVWDEVNVSDNEVFLQNCYIEPEHSDDMLRIASELLEQRSATDTIGATADVADPRKMLLSKDAINEERPVVLLGRIGHGKSTFLKYLRRIAASDLLQKKYIQLDIDFLSRPTTSEEVKGFVLSEVERQLRELFGVALYSDTIVRNVLRNELRDFRQTPRAVHLTSTKQDAALAAAEVDFIETFTSIPERYFPKLMRYLRFSDGKSIAIFFDNLDRRDDKLQEHAFLLASTIASEWTALVFVCLRPGTVQRSQARGVLDTISPRIITISPPKTNLVLRKRFQYASKYATNNLPKGAYVRASFTKEIQNELPKAAMFFDVCDNSFRRNAGLATQFEAVANGNMRYVLKYVREVITSNHLDTAKALDKVKATGAYDLAEHETLRALLFGQYIQYDPNSSLCVNLFDIQRSDPTEHFTRFFLLEFCHRHANSVDKYGFLPISTLHSYMAAFGYGFDHVHSAIKALFSKRCVEGRGYDEEAAELGEELRITSLGSYHFTKLVRDFVYLDAVIVDTPILDNTVRLNIADVTAIKDRFTRSRDFLRYLDRCSESLVHPDSKRLWSAVSTALANDITDAENSYTEFMQRKK